MEKAELAKIRGWIKKVEIDSKRARATERRRRDVSDEDTVEADVWKRFMKTYPSWEIMK